MRRKKEEDQDHPTAPFWMVTYGDMVTLLLTFFILLVSFANLDEVKFGQAAHSLKGALGILKRQKSLLRSSGQDIAQENMYLMMNVYEGVKKDLEEIAHNMGIEDDISVETTETGMLIKMGDKVLFDLGKADLRPEAFPILNVVGKSIRDKAKEVLVSGHTDNIPINNPEFPSNWELSTSRALRVVKYLIYAADVPPQILAATGYSEFRPVKPNDSPQNRQTNRRVEILLTWK